MKSEEHLARVMAWVTSGIPPKYRDGQREHGGVLDRKAVLPMLREEALDICVYVATLEEQHQTATRLLGEAIAGQDWGRVAAAFNVLLFGNPEGEPGHGG